MARTLAAVAREVQGRLVGADQPFGAVTTDTRALGAGLVVRRDPGRSVRRQRLRRRSAYTKGAAGALVSRLADVAAAADRGPRLAPRVRRDGARVACVVLDARGRRHGQQRQDDGQGAHRRDLGRQPLGLRHAGQPEQRHRRAADADAADAPSTTRSSSSSARTTPARSTISRGLAQPTVGVITNAAAAHLEGFGSLRGVCVAKGELLDHLPRAGTAVLNADDQFRSDWVARSRCEFTVTFGFAPSADCRVLGEPQLLGDGLASSACACPTARRPTSGCRCSAGRTSRTRSRPRLPRKPSARAPKTSSPASRARRRCAAGCEPCRAAAAPRSSTTATTRIPGSVHAALDHLAALARPRIFVFGNMAELGPTAPALHQEIGEYARGRCDLLFAIGELASEAAQAFGAAGRRVADIDAARAALDPVARERRDRARQGLARHGARSARARRSRPSTRAS